MIPHDYDLSQSQLRHKDARAARMLLELLIGASMLAAVLVTSVWGGGRHWMAHWLLLALAAAWTELLRRGIQRFGEAAEHREAMELARIAPFFLVAGYTLAWLGAHELAAFVPAPVGYIWTALLMTAAAVLTWQRDTDARYLDALIVVCWVALLCPGEYASPRMAPTWTLLARTVVLIAANLALGVRDMPGRASGGGRSSTADVAIIAAKAAGVRLVQVAWMLHCSPLALLCFAVPLAAVYEVRTRPTLFIRADGPAL